MAAVNSARAQGAEVRIESWIWRNSAMELQLATEWDRRYRIESAVDLNSWKTVLVTEPSLGTSLAAVVTDQHGTTGFFRASTFDWEELRADLKAARQRWREKGLITYQFEFRWECYCQFQETVRVEVRDGSIRGVTSVSTGVLIPQDQWTTYLTIEGLFDWIESQLAQHPVDIRLTFDPVLGAPGSGFVDQSRLLADEEMGFSAKSFSY